MIRRSEFYRTWKPPKPLDRFIDSFWLYEGYHPKHEHERVLPTGTLELVIPISGQHLVWRELAGPVGSCEGALVCGPRCSAFDVPTAQQQDLAGVHFRPGGAWPFFRIPMGELANLNIPLVELWRHRATDLVEELMHAEGPEARFSLLAAFFLERLDYAPPSHGSVHVAVDRLRDAEDVSVAQLVRLSGLSHRRFVEVFRREVGLVPRDFGRVARFQRAFSLARQQSTLGGVELAGLVGYFDQSHWLRECKKLTRMGARALLAASRSETSLPPEERGQMLPIK